MVRPIGVTPITSMKPSVPVAFAFLFAVQLSTALARPEAMEIGSPMTGQLPGGKEADGIIGDFLLRNDRIEAVISGNLPMRRANMSTFYGEDGITPGCVYDLTLRGRNNDQLTVFTPSFQQGPVSWVRKVEEPEARSPGVQDAKVEVFVSAQVGGGISRRHVYALRDGWSGLMVTTTLRNESDRLLKATFEDRWTNFIKTGVAPGGILWADSVDPADRCGYAVGPVEDSLGLLKKAAGDLMPGESVTYSRFLAVGDSPLSAVSEVAGHQGVKSTVAGIVLDGAGKPIKGGVVWFRPRFSVELPATTKTRSNLPDSNGRLSGMAYVDEAGKFRAVLPPADHASDSPNKHRLRSCGIPGPGVEVRIHDNDNNRDCEVGEVGEIWIRSPQVMLGYWKRPEDTAKSINADGWFTSGDAGYIDADGYVYIHDRVKDMIVSGGENVYPAEVENVLMSHPGIADVAVIGIPHEKWGETALAVVVKTAGSDVSEDDIIAYSRERLARFKCPTQVQWIDVLPRNPSGKVLKKDLREPYWAGRERRVN